MLLQATDLVTLEEVKNFLNSSIVGQALHSDHRARLRWDAAKISSCREVAKIIGRTWGAKGRESNSEPIGTDNVEKIHSKHICPLS